MAMSSRKIQNPWFFVENLPNLAVLFSNARQLQEASLCASGTSIIDLKVSNSLSATMLSTKVAAGHVIASNWSFVTEKWSKWPVFFSLDRGRHY
jgi:hypothetical protein